MGIIINKEENIFSLNTRIGINNVNDRIKLIYGNDYGIEIKSKLGKGTEIVISLPKQLEK